MREGGRRPAAEEPAKKGATLCCTWPRYPGFLLEHIARQWRDVPVLDPDPERCFRVDAALSFCGCTRPSPALRQYLYWYQASGDFDVETLSVLVEFFSGDNIEARAPLLAALEFERDCGLPRQHYLDRLRALSTEALPQACTQSEDLPEFEFALGA